MEKELRILMLEDLEEDAGLLDRVLKKERIVFTRKRVDSREEFSEALVTYRPDLILSDHALPQFNSIEALKIVREQKIDAPFIIVTGTVSEEFAVTCLKKGADDYVLKSNLSRLPSAIAHAIHERQNEKIRKEQEQIVLKQNEALIKVNKELDLFVYSLSHSLRSPVATVLGIVNLAKLDDALSKATGDHYIELIGESAKKLDKTLKEIFDYSQNLRTGIKTEALDLKALIDETFNRLNHLPGSTGIEKQIELQVENSFYSDSYRLSVVLTNLLSNSIKYRDARKSPSIIHIKATVSSMHATISIFDNGVGIPKDYLPHVFAMFYRANEQSDGAGLGLFVAKEVVDKLQGTLVIASDYEHWTRIDLALPNMKN